jgi:hypothetical protein
MKQSEIAYGRRVSWHNDIINKISKLSTILSDDERVKKINSILTEAIEKLEKTVNPNYIIDRATKTKLEEISGEMAKKDPESLKRKGEGEGRRNFIKFFSFTESPSDFLDKRHQAVIAQQEKMEIPYITEPKPKAEPVIKPEAKKRSTKMSSAKTPSVTRSQTPSPSSTRSGSVSSTVSDGSRTTVNMDSSSALSSRTGSISSVDSEREGASSKIPPSVRKAATQTPDTPRTSIDSERRGTSSKIPPSSAPTPGTSRTTSGRMSDKEWDEAVRIESERVAEIGKKVIIASSRSGTSDEFKRKQAMLVTGLFDNTHVNAAVKADHKREEELGSKGAVREDKARRAREEIVSKAAATISAPTGTPTKPPSRTPTTRNM